MSTSLLLHFAGAHGATSFIDEAEHPMTRISTPVISAAQSKFGGVSGLFGGGSCGLSTPASSDFGMGTGDFTVEAWAYTSATGVTVVDLRDAGFDEGQFYINGSGKIAYYGATGGTLAGSTTLPTSTWVHLAWARESGTLRMLVNGAVDYSGALTTDFGTSRQVFVGSTYSSTQAFNGYLSEVRISKGQAVYTGAFTVPSNPFFINNPDPYWPYNVVYLPMEGLDGSTSFTDQCGRALSVRGAPTLSTAQSKFGTSSYLSNGALNNCLVLSGAELLFPGDFTIEFFVRPSTDNYGADIIAFNRDVSGYNAFSIIAGVNGGELSLYTENAVRIASGFGQMPVGQWRHVALTRKAGVYRLFLHGNLVGSYTQTASTTVSGTLSVGGVPGAYSFVGFIDDVSVKNGIAKYDATFTPPTVKTTSGGGDNFYYETVLGLHMEGPDGSTKFMEGGSASHSVIGAARLSTARKKFGSSSALFDGSSAVLFDQSINVTFTTSFVMEMFVYVASFGANGAMLLQKQSGSAAGGFEFLILSDGSLQFKRDSSTVTATSGAGAITTGSFIHVAVQWDGATYALFKNGTVVATATDATPPANVTGGLRLGNHVSASGYGLNGNVDELRITNGAARY